MTVVPMGSVSRPWEAELCGGGWALQADHLLTGLVFPPLCHFPPFILAVLSTIADFPPVDSSIHGHPQVHSEILLCAQRCHGCWGFSMGHSGAPEPMQFALSDVCALVFQRGSKASHTLQSSGPGPLGTK